MGIGILLIILCVLMFLLGFKACYDQTEEENKEIDAFWGIKIVNGKYVALPLEQFPSNYSELGFLTIYRDDKIAKKYCEIMNFKEGDK